MGIVQDIYEDVYYILLVSKNVKMSNFKLKFFTERGTCVTKYKTIVCDNEEVFLQIMISVTNSIC